jgi:hypothetical protein
LILLPEARAALDNYCSQGLAKLDAIENKIKESLTEGVKNTMLENIKASITDDLVKPRAKPLLIDGPCILRHVYDAVRVKRLLTEKEQTFLHYRMVAAKGHDYGRVGEDLEKIAFEIDKLQANLIEELTKKHAIFMV